MKSIEVPMRDFFQRRRSGPALEGESGSLPVQDARALLFSRHSFTCSGVHSANARVHVGIPTEARG